jgi:hypothetical protein
MGYDRGVSDLMGYDTSWDWLIPVVEKIETIDINGEMVILEAIGKRAKFILEFGCRILPDNEGRSKIEATYKAVVEFIKWYNENKED